jgi:hypothetical protein
MVINPEFTAAQEIARLLRFPSAIQIDTFAKGRVEILKFKIQKESPLCDLRVADISQKLNCDILICGVERGEDAFIPGGDFVLRQNDYISIVATIKNATVMPRKLWNNKFRNGNPDKTDEDVTSVMKERPKYSAETNPYYKVQTLKMQNMIDAVVKEADKKVAMQMGLVSVTDAKAMKEAYNLKAEEVIELMSEGLLPEIKDFLEEEEGLSSAQKMQWLDDLSNAFEGTKKDASLKMNHKFAKGNEVNMEVQKTMEREIQVQREGVKD